MSDVVCANTECPEHEIPKANPMNYPPADIICGACGQPTEGVTMSETAPAPEEQPAPDPDQPPEPDSEPTTGAPPPEPEPDPPAS